MKRDFREQKLMHTVLQADKDDIDDGKTVREAANQNVGAFAPDMAYSNIVDNYREAKRLMGDRMIRELTGYDSDYIERNLNIPEFERELREQIKQNVDDLQANGVLDDDYQVTDHGLDAAALSLISEELDDLTGEGYLGEKPSDHRYQVGEQTGYKPYTRGARYGDVSTRRTVKLAARRGHTAIQPEDLRLKDHQSEGKAEIVLCVDTSGSMTGDKLRAAKQAGVGLAHKAGRDEDDVGMVFFSSDVQASLPIGTDTFAVARQLVQVDASGETDLSVGLTAALELFTGAAEDEHIFLLTDALQTKGERPVSAVNPVLERLEHRGVSLSVLGVNLDGNGRDLAEQIVDRCEGELYDVRNSEETDRVVIGAYDQAT